MTIQGHSSVGTDIASPVGVRRIIGRLGLFSAVTFIWAIFVHASGYELSEKNYLRTQRNGLETLRLFNPKDFYFVGVGKSPTYAAAFLYFMGADVALIPHARTYPPHTTTNLKPYELAQYDSSFRRLLPDFDPYGNRAVVLMDATKNGVTLLTDAKMMTSYFSQKSFTARIHALAFGNFTFAHEGISFQSIPNLPGDFLGWYVDGYNSIVSPFAAFGGNFFDAAALLYLRPSAEHYEFLEKLRSRMLSDPELSPHHSTIQSRQLPSARTCLSPLVKITGY